MNLVTLEDAKTEAAKGLRQAIAVSIKKFEGLLRLTCADIIDDDSPMGSACGICYYYNAHCDDCILYQINQPCEGTSQFATTNDAWLYIVNENVTTITQFRKETRKMIAILKKLYKETP